MSSRDKELYLIPFSGKHPEVPDNLKLLIPEAENSLRKYGELPVYTYSSGGNLYIFWKRGATYRSAPSLDNLNLALDKVEEFQSDYDFTIVYPTESEMDNYMKLVLRSPNVIFNY
jgi:hypothetical protein